LLSNKESRDIILEKELQNILGDNLVLNLTRENKEGYHQGRIDKAYLKKHVEDFSKKFYICGPQNFTSNIKKLLEGLGVQVSTILIEGGG